MEERKEYKYKNTQFSKEYKLQELEKTIANPLSEEARAILDYVFEKQDEMLSALVIEICAAEKISPIDLMLCVQNEGFTTKMWFERKDKKGLDKV